MFNLATDTKHLVAKVLNTKGSMVSQYPRYLITSEETFEVLRGTKHYRVSSNTHGMPIHVVCDLKVVLDNDLAYGEVEIR